MTEVIAAEHPIFSVGPEVTLALRRGLSWICSACSFDMTGLSLREALRHFYVEHGTESDRDIALRDFPGMAIGSGRIGAPQDCSTYSASSETISCETRYNS